MHRLLASRSLRRPLTGVLAAATAAVALTLVPTDVHADVKPGGIMSPNVTWLGTLPLDAPGIGARVVQVGSQTRLYVTGSKGLSIYDVSTPTLPLLMGTLPLPHFENEDVEVSDDGTRVLIANEIGPSYVIDTSLPQLPRLARTLSLSTHTFTCVDPTCSWVYSSEGEIVDLRDLATPRILRGAAGWQQKAEAQIGFRLSQGAHDLNQDDAGFVITDTWPRLMLDVSNPEFPVVKTRSVDSVPVPVAYQHNNRRPDAAAWTPRPATDTGPLKPGEDLRPGELLLAQGETNFRPRCGGTSGPFATWSLKNWDKGEPMTLIDVYRPVNGLYTDGNPAVNVLGCSGHWFDERDGLVAAAWYEHGTRFLTVNSKGAITELGFFQPVAGSAFAAYFVSDEVVYVLDFVRGIDVLRFDRS